MSPQTPDPLDTLLHALRDAQPSPTLEARVLAHLHSATTQPTAPPKARRLYVLPITAAVAAALLLALFLSRRPIPPSPAEHASSPAATLVQPSTLPLTPTVHQPTPHHRPHPTPSLAALETAAPSVPPPPLPITAEERNIQRFRSLHSAVSLAALSPEAVSLHHAADKTDLQTFFDPDHKEN